MAQKKIEHLSAFDCIVSYSTLDHLASQDDIRKGINGLPGIRKDGDVTVYFRLLIGEELPESIERVFAEKTG